MSKKVILTILDGFGYSELWEWNAVAQADTPNIDFLLNKYPHTLIGTSGEHVGLPIGQMGNSEVGHLNIGAGRIVYQDITRIDKSIADGDFFHNEPLNALFNRIPETNAIHLMGLLSDGGVHSSLNHLKALLKMAKMSQKGRVYLHAFTDGRDTSPHSAVNFLIQIEDFMQTEGIGEVATVSGRYYAMDRDNRWDRMKKAYDAMVYAKGDSYNSSIEAVQNSYQKGITDEFIIPSVIKKDGFPTALIQRGDGAVFFNFRADRARQMTTALTVEPFDGFQRSFLGLDVVTMTKYDENLTLPIAFPHQHLTNILGEVISQKGLNQLRIAETEKYAHVTYFFNGGEETPFPNEDRILIPSPKVATYDLQPEMSAYQVADTVVENINTGKYHLIVLNFANCDMVGHSGIFAAAKKAVETVDECAGKVYQTAMKNDYTMLLTADHGNAEQMRTEDGEAHTIHTTNPVHFIYIDSDRRPKLRTDGALCNIAPTILEILNVEKPPEMSEPMTIKH